MIVPDYLSSITKAVDTVIPVDRKHLLSLACGEKDEAVFKVTYDVPGMTVPGMGVVEEAEVVRCKNGLSVNYPDKYMRRRDPECLIVADEEPTDKVRYPERFPGEEFEELRQRTFDWMKSLGKLILMPFWAGRESISYPALCVAPANAGFFALALADLQGFIPAAEIPDDFQPKAVIYVAPPFRHTDFDHKQVVVHNRRPEMHEIFSYNLYPGPSAKKGVYGILINIGEEEEWVTLHCSTVKITTPYDNEFVIMHEGASGGGKSEMIQKIEREPDGRVLVGVDTVTGEHIKVTLSDTCELHPVMDDMALCHPKLQNESGKLIALDAEDGWFLRVDHMTHYGTQPELERAMIHPPEPLLFLNLDGKPDATCLVWEHTMDEPGVPCPNPRVVMPRRFVNNVINDAVEVDVRSFGVRTPPCTREKPNYGIIGMIHVLPPALAWLWRLVAPRGHANPSIVSTEGMSSEGVGSYWPFALGKMVSQANLLLEQIRETPNTGYHLIPNQYIGVYHVGFKAEWIAREYLARRGSAQFKTHQLIPARCPILGYTLEHLKIDGFYVPAGLLRVNEHRGVGNEAYDAGAEILTDFFRKELKKYQTPELDPVGKTIIDICMDNGGLEDYASVM